VQGWKLGRCFLTLLAAALLISCAGGGTTNQPAQGVAVIPFPQPEDLTLTAQGGGATLVIPAQSFNFPITLVFRRLPADGLGPNGQPLLMVVEMEVSEIRPLPDGQGQGVGGDQETGSAPTLDDLTLAGSLTITFQLASPLPAGTSLPVFRYSELNRAYVDEGLSATVDTGGGEASVSVTQIGRYALGTLPPERLPPDPPGAPRVFARSTLRVGITWDPPPPQMGVNLYRGDAEGTSFTKVNDAPLTGTQFFDALDSPGDVSYQITLQWLPDGPESAPSPVVFSPNVSPDFLFVLGHGQVNFLGRIFPAVSLSQGNYLVAAKDMQRIFIFSRGGNLITSVGLEQSFFLMPGPMVEAPDGRWFVVDDRQDKVLVMTADFSSGFAFGGGGSEGGRFLAPSGIALLDSSVIVSDASRDDLQEFTLAGVFKRRFGIAGDATKQVQDPLQVIPDGKGGLLVVDAGKDRLVRFDNNLVFKEEIKPLDPVSGEPLLAEPRGVAIDNGGDIWVTSAARGRLVHLDGQGNFVEEFGTFGSGAGEFGPAGPGYLAFDPDTGYLLVADPDGGRVMVFRT